MSDKKAELHQLISESEMHLAAARGLLSRARPGVLLQCMPHLSAGRQALAAFRDRVTHKNSKDEAFLDDALRLKREVRRISQLVHALAGHYAAHLESSALGVSGYMPGGGQAVDCGTARFAIQG